MIKPGKTLRLAASSLLSLAFGGAASVHADDDVSGAPVSSTIERVGASATRRAGSYAVALGAMYGHTESVLGQGDAHRRTGGSLLLEATPLSWLTLGLRLDGRYDKHSFGDGSSDDGWVGEPRVHVQIDRALSESVSGGLRAVMHVPGSNAPSVVPGATTLDAIGLLTFRATPRLRVTALGGYRIDGSAKSIDDAAALGPGDRQALMVSDFDAALAGVGAQYHQGAFDFNASFSADVLLGAGAPAAGASPMRLGVGARGWVARAWALEIAGEYLTSKRAEMPMPGPLVPVPPRYAVLFGAVATFGASPTPRAAAPTPEPLVEAPASIRGRLHMPGRRPRGLSVALLRDGEQERALEVGEDGAFVAQNVKAGTVVIVVEAPGWKPARHELSLRPGVPAQVKTTLVRSGPSGQIRGVVRSFTGKAVVATVRIAGRKSGAGTGQTLRSDEGTFTAAIDPGQYDVIIEASGYEPQTRAVTVEEDGVTVLNVDLRRGAR